MDNEPDYIELPNDGKLFEILPKNARTDEIRRKRADEAEQARIKAEEMRQQKEREEKVKRSKERMAEADRAKREKAAKEAEAKRRQEDAAQNQMEPALLHLFEKMSYNNTPIDVSLQGVQADDLGQIRTGILAKWLSVNNSILLLDLNRMNIGDEEGKIIAQYLRKNVTLRSLHMEGNLCGPKTATEFAKTLKVNTSLKLLNLESNALAAENGADVIGVYEFAEFIPENTTLLSLSVANNQLDQKIGELFLSKLEQNKTLIDFDFSMNNFAINESHAIQDILKANKADYDGERLKEWRERKSMRGEDNALRTKQLAESSAKAQAIMEQEARETRESELNEKWRLKMLETEVEKQQLIQQLVEAAIHRGTKKKKKGKKKK